MITTDPARTAERLAKLEAYYRSAVLDSAGTFVCACDSQCRRSALGQMGTAFYEAQGESLSPHYDVHVSGVPMRVLIVPMETGLGEPKHPTYHWDWLARPYLHDEVVPTLTLARQRVLELHAQPALAERVDERPDN